MTTDELHVFFAVIMVMAVIKKPNMHMYWSCDAVFEGPPIFRKEVTSRNRFTGITKFLRFSSAVSVVQNNPGTRLEP